MAKIQSPQAQGIAFAGKVSERSDKWADFGKLRSDFLKLDTSTARKTAIDTLKGTGDSDLRQFANALEEATGTKTPERVIVQSQPRVQSSGESGSVSSSSGYSASAG